jgi:hypothetical protein
MSQRITPSLVISIIALMVALGGASYAAIQIPKNSVGTKQLKRNAVSAAKLKKNSVNSAKVRNGSLLRSDFKAGQLPGAAWYKERRPSVPLFDVTGSFTPVVTTAELPAGSYVLNGRANVIGGGGVTSSLICSLASDAAQNFTVGNNEMLPLSLSAVAVLEEPGTVPLSCLKSSGTPQIAQATIIATRVTKVTGTLP